MGNQNRKTQQHQEEEHQLADNFTCEICFESLAILPDKKKFQQNINRCIHPFCTDCMIKYIQVKLEENVSYIKCPHNTCNYYLEPLSWRPKIAPQLFDKWCNLLCESMVLAFDRRVYCPNDRCSELILNECGDVKRCVCPACRKPFCFECKVPWHAGYVCEETGEKRDQNDVVFGVVSERNGWKRCPKCRHCVELVLGCYTVKCRCGVTFCYKCGKHISAIMMWFDQDYYCCKKLYRPGETVWLFGSFHLMSN